MKTVWYLITIFVPLNLCHQINSDLGLRYAYTVTVSADQTACVGTGYLDGESFITYSSDIIHSRASWVTKDNVDSEKSHFKRRCKELEFELKKMTNKSVTAGIQTVQVSTECISEKDTATAYDGTQVKSFSLNDTHAQGCSYRLRIYRDLMSKNVKAPHVTVERRLLHHSQTAKLRCLARDFYPANLEMHWCRENDSLVHRMSEKNMGPLPQGDGLYRRHVEIIVNIGEENLYVCEINGVATQSTMKSFKWEGSVSGFSDGTAFLLALFIPAIAAVIIIVFGFVWHRQGDILPIRVPRRSSNSNSGPSTGRRATPLANTAV